MCSSSDISITTNGLPHSEICGSKVISTSPQLFAGNRVLLRLFVPRHPPCALSNLTFNFVSYSKLFLLDFYLDDCFVTLWFFFFQYLISVSSYSLLNIALSHNFKEHFFVELNGLEPLTPALQGRCSTN